MTRPPHRRWAALVLAVASHACIAPSVLDEGDRAVDLHVDATWSDADASRIPGTYVSTELTGPLAASLRKLVYLFEPDGTYTGAALVDDDRPHFEVVTGTWAMDGELLCLDGGPPAGLAMSADGSLRLSGAEGVVLLRREREL